MPTHKKDAYELPSSLPPRAINGTYVPQHTPANATNNNQTLESEPIRISSKYDFLFPRSQDFTKVSTRCGPEKSPRPRREAEPGRDWARAKRKAGLDAAGRRWHPDAREGCL